MMLLVTAWVLAGAAWLWLLAWAAALKAEHLRVREKAREAAESQKAAQASWDEILAAANRLEARAAEFNQQIEKKKAEIIAIGERLQVARVRR